MDKYEIRPGSLTTIRDCQGDSQRCLASWSLCLPDLLYLEVYWNSQESAERLRMIIVLVSGYMLLSCSPFENYKLMRWMVAHQQELCMALIYIGLYTHTAISA